MPPTPEGHVETSDMFDLTGKRIFVAGHGGMVGRALLHRISRESCEVVTIDRAALDLRDQKATARWLKEVRPHGVIVAAAKVGGIMAQRTQPVEFLLDNLLIETAVIAGAFAAGVEKLLFLSSSAIYPAQADNPIRENSLLTGPIDPSHEGYAIAKIAGIRLCQAYRRQHGADFIAAVPTNLYGPGNSYDPLASHLVPAIIRKVHEAKQTGGPVIVWGTGLPRRELLHAQDCADGCLHLLRHYSGENPVNLGSGEDLTVMELTQLIMEVVGYNGPLLTDPARPDGVMRKLMDPSCMRELGWQPTVMLKDGLHDCYRDFLSQNHGKNG